MSTSFPNSPIGFADFAIVHFELDYRNVDESSEIIRSALQFNMKAESDRIPGDDGRLACVCTLSVNCELLGPEEDGSRSSLGIAKLSSRVKCFSQFPDSMSESECWEILENNAITHLYSRARVYIEMLTSSCPGGVFSLPVINPVQFMRESAVEDDDCE